MKLQTKIDIPQLPLNIKPTDKLLFVGSCFATEMACRFKDNCFDVKVNPYGTMYNPASVLHTVQKINAYADVAVITLGTNHVYILKETGEIVDNCNKRPSYLFEEKELTVRECADYLCLVISTLKQSNPSCKVVFTVSPIRYQKYGFHESRLSKATLLLAADEVTRMEKDTFYFPSYEIMDDELRDYRFYKPDMLHPSEQAVDYIYECFCKSCLSKEAFLFMEEWQPIRQALSHRPFNPDGDEYKQFLAKTKQREEAFRRKWRL